MKEIKLINANDIEYHGAYGFGGHIDFATKAEIDALPNVYDRMIEKEAIYSVIVSLNHRSLEAYKKSIKLRQRAEREKDGRLAYESELVAGYAEGLEKAVQMLETMLEEEEGKE